MKSALLFLTVFISMGVDAQYVEKVDALGNAIFPADSTGDRAQPSHGTQSSDELRQIERYLRSREEQRAAERDKAKKRKKKGSIGIGTDPLYLQQRLRSRRCSGLWRLGLKCR